MVYYRIKVVDIVECNLLQSDHITEYSLARRKLMLYAFSFVLITKPAIHSYHLEVDLKLITNVLRLRRQWRPFMGLCLIELSHRGDKIAVADKGSRLRCIAVALHNKRFFPVNCLKRWNYLGSSEYKDDLLLSGDSLQAIEYLFFFGIYF